VIAGYTLLTGAHPSAVRAGIMLGLAGAAALVGRVADPLTSLQSFMTRQALLRAWGEFQETHALIVAPICTDIPFKAGTDLSEGRVAEEIRSMRMATAVNAQAPGIIAEEAKKLGAAMVHYSTDYIFAGLKTTPYSESDAPNPQSVYGRTKLQGEKAIQHSGVDHLIFRTAWIYAREGKNFLLTILRLATQREELRIISDQIGAPTSSYEIAGATTQILAKLLAHEKRIHPLAKVSGTYHMTAAGETSWAGFAEAILEHARSNPPRAPWYLSATSNLPLIAKRVVPITTAEYPTPAQRPAYAVLSNQSLADTFQTHLPDWRVQLSSVFAGS